MTIDGRYRPFGPHYWSANVVEVVDMDADGVEIRPIKQMSGGTSFNEVFFNDCRIPDS